MAAKVNRIAVGVLAVVVVFSASRVSQSPRTGARPLPNPKNGVGLIEHRGRYYFIEQLMDPKFRQVSQDPFVREFTISNTVAEPLTGPDPEKDFSRRSYRNLLGDWGDGPARPLPWAGMNPEHHHE
jgi:hypothetical protein